MTDELRGRASQGSHKYTGPIDRPPVLVREKVMAEKRVYRTLKRVQDIILSLLALLILFIPMLVLSLIIRLDSPGASSIFCQKRVGLDGRIFSMLKFRTMIPNAENKLDELKALNEMTGPVFKIRNDPRITRVGRVIRKISVDELPQLVNVLKGDMSIVGPRPALPAEVEQYGPFERQRLFVIPGLTCYWQVQPRRNDLPFEQWVDLDVKYIQERSFRTDWRIIFKTVGAVFHGEGE